MTNIDYNPTVRALVQGMYWYKDNENDASFKTTFVKNPDNIADKLEKDFCNFLQKVQELLGDRDNKYNEFEIIFRNGPPQIGWFQENKLTITLSIVQVNSDKYRTTQLAHEIVHCLNPCKYGTANMLEEGIAVYFSEEINQDYEFYENTGKYQTARDLFKQLPNGYELVRKIRERKSDKSISSITEDDLVMEYGKMNYQMNPNLQGIIKQLVAKF